MKESVSAPQAASLRTECGREFSNVFKAVKLVRDERHNFHVVYRTYQDEYIYSFCNPFLDTDAHSYQLISEARAKSIFLHRLSQENAHELFSSPMATLTRLHA
ncbi:hypothetical protein [Pontibacter actiniarum]|uniref:Uncharacterized protein n=1 Tax=Pontibacter actiniarum TaxID=323450 RepID=A0A1X9YUF0_9BACT|nr:hypothetical protein [Pontibacter actiniarum]ARS36515.1 hypothetical protein CA264_14345 [Pontibacter actiniarum]